MSLRPVDKRRRSSEPHPLERRRVRARIFLSRCDPRALNCVIASMALWAALQRLWDPVSTPISLALGAIASQLWRRYLNRMAAFRSSACHNRLATSASYPQLGNVVVLWNDQPVQNLQFCNIELQNESSRDFTNVEIKFWYSGGTEILGDRYLTGTSQVLPMDDTLFRRDRQSTSDAGTRARRCARPQYFG